jgi:hypothetical protein
MIKLILCAFLVVGCAVDTTAGSEPETVEMATIPGAGSHASTIDGAACPDDAADLTIYGCWCEGVYRCCSWRDPFGQLYVSCDVYSACKVWGDE